MARVSKPTLRSAAVERHLTIRRRRLALIALAAGLPCALMAMFDAPPLLVWNASASTPRGLYRVYPRLPPQRGDMVIAMLPEAMRAMAAERHYLPRGVPLVKRVAAVSGDKICGLRGNVSINDRVVADRKPVDAVGRNLPVWQGCRTLLPDEVLLLGESPWSFDGRYFGVTTRPDILGRAVLIWRA